MSPKFTDEQLAWAFTTMGLVPEDFLRVKQAKTYAAAEREVARIKAVAKQHYREAALRLHPDRTGDDPQKTDQFKLLAAVHAELEKLEAPERPKARPVVGRYVYGNRREPGTEGTVFRQGNIIFTVRVA